MFERLQGILERHVSDHRPDRLIHLIQRANQTSVRVAEKLGATLDHRIDLNGVAVDVYAPARPTGW